MDDKFVCQNVWLDWFDLIWSSMTWPILNEKYLYFIKRGRGWNFIQRLVSWVTIQCYSKVFLKNMRKWFVTTAHVHLCSFRVSLIISSEVEFYELLTHTIVKLKVRSQVNLKIPIQTLKGKDQDWYYYNQTGHQHHFPHPTTIKLFKGKNLKFLLSDNSE